MYISSISLFAPSWLLLCLINPFYSRAERLYLVPSLQSDPVQHESRPIQSVPFEKEFQSDVPESSQYNIYYRNYYNSVQPKVFPKDMYSGVNVKQNAANSMPGSKVGKQYKLYPESRYAGNREILKKESSTYFSQMQRYEEARKRNEEIMKKMNVLDKLLSENSDENDIESKNIIEDVTIPSIPEETKRVVRQVRKKRPGFFWTLARVAFEVQIS